MPNEQSPDPDPQEERPPPPPQGQQRPSGRQDGGGTTSLGLEPGLAAAGAYFLGWISGLVVLFTEKEHGEVRFHAAQSTIVSGALTAVFVALSILSMIPLLGLIFLLVEVLLGLASLALWIYLLIQGYQLKHTKLPVAGDVAERWATSGPGL